MLALAYDGALRREELRMDIATTGPIHQTIDPRTGTLHAVAAIADELLMIDDHHS
jgi:hypothetical protein